ncbi:MAG TPA: type II toxin-antitoxin system HicB family antitoxin [Gemmatales bacterium]|nr:type II toxin-antitoxin system HicB family antitoxin [Gemmatales bacterium]
MRYQVKLIRSEEGVSIHVPALPGCWSQGATEEEAKENIRDAIREYLASIQDESAGAELQEVEAWSCRSWRPTLIGEYAVQCHSATVWSMFRCSAQR